MHFMVKFRYTLTTYHKAEQRFQSLKAIKGECKVVSNIPINPSVKESLATMQQILDESTEIVNKQLDKNFHVTSLHELFINSKSFSQPIEGEALSALDYFEFMQSLLSMYKLEYTTKVNKEMRILC
jgi:hypothetical protein